MRFLSIYPFIFQPTNVLLSIIPVLEQSTYIPYRGY